MPRKSKYQYNNDCSTVGVAKNFAKIRKVMQELDYHPNSQARGLVNGSTFTIGLVMDAGNKNAFSNEKLTFTITLKR